MSNQPGGHLEISDAEKIKRLTAEVRSLKRSLAEMDGYVLRDRRILGELIERVKILEGHTAELNRQSRAMKQAAYVG